MSARQNIYIIDDEAGFGQSIHQLLERRGFRVHYFIAAEDFIRALPVLNPAGIVLSDINMPGLSGFDLCRTVRCTPGIGRIPIILMTGKGNRRAESLEAGADDLLCKPFSIDDLVTKIAVLTQTPKEVPPDSPGTSSGRGRNRVA